MMNTAFGFETKYRIPQKTKKKLMLTAALVLFVPVFAFLLFGLEPARAWLLKNKIDLTENKATEGYVYTHTVDDSDFISRNAPFYYDDYEEIVYYYYHEPEAPDAAPYQLSWVNMRSGIANGLCSDKNCYHNNLNYTYQCDLCKLGRSIWFDGDGGLYAVYTETQYYNSDRGKVVYAIGQPTDGNNNWLPTKIVWYDIATAKMYTLYENESDSTVCKILAANDRYIWFSETYGGPMNDPVADDFCVNVTDIPEWYLTKNSLQLIKGEGGFELWGYDWSKEEPAFVKKPFSYDIRQELWDACSEERRPCSIKRYDILTKTTLTLSDGGITPGVLKSYDNYKEINGRIYRSENGGYYSYDDMMTPESRFTVVGAKKFTSLDDVQYDPFTGNIYFLGRLAGSEDTRLYKVRATGQARALREVRLCDSESYDVLSYQLTYTRIIYQVHDKNAEPRSVKLNSYTENEYTDVTGGVIWSCDYLGGDRTELWRDDNSDTILMHPTVIGDYIYADEYGEVCVGEAQWTIYPCWQSRISVETGKMNRLVPDGWTLYK